MTPRCVDWHPLAGTDPVPGDPVAVLAVAASMRVAGVAAMTQSRRLACFGGCPSWHGAAADAFAGVVDDLPRLLERVATRYAGAAEALAEYAAALTAAQATAVRALALARSAGPEVEPQRNLAMARRFLEEAIHSRDRAARVAATRLRAVADDSLRDHTSLGGLLAGAAHGAATFLVDTANVRDWAPVLGGVALVTAWCPPVAAGFELLALTSGGLALTADLTLAATEGDSSHLGEAGKTAIGMATLGLGRAFGAASRASGAAARAEDAVTRAGSEAARRVAQADLTAARAAVPARPLVPRADNLRAVLPRRMAAEIRADWQAMRAPGAGLRATAAQEWQEVRDAALGRYGAAVAANTAARLSAAAADAPSNAKAVAGAVGLRGRPAC